MTTADYNRLVDEKSDRLLSYALKLTNEYGWSQDLVQDSFLKLWLNIEKISVEHSGPFLYKVLFNKMLDDKRKTSRTRLMEVLPERLGHSSRLENKDLVDQAFKQLKDQQKQIILLRDWEGHSYKEIGDILDCNESLVKVQLFRARKKMKKIIDALSKDYTACNENK